MVHHALTRAENKRKEMINKYAMLMALLVRSNQKHLCNQKWDKT